MVNMIIDGKHYNCKTQEQADYFQKKHKIMFHKNEIQKLELECHLLQEEIEFLYKDSDEHPF